MSLIKNISSLIRTIINILLVTLFILFLIEYSLSYTSWLDKEKQVDERSKLSVYDNEWGPEYWKDWRKIVMNQEYYPYYLWATREGKSKYVNVGEDGNRLTINPKFTQVETSEAIKIFMFGGSTMWGSSVPDQYTIPSYLSKKINSKTIQYEVFNMGQPGHVQTQEIIQLITLLKRGHRPKYVFFLDGANDSSMALIRPKNAYAHLRFNHTRDVFNLNFEYLKRHYVYRLNLYLLAQKINQSIRQSQPRSIIMKNKKRFMQDANSLIDSGKSNILSNYMLLDALSKKYKFQYKIFLQPTLTSKENKSLEELGIWKQYENHELSFAYEAFHYMYKEIDYSRYPNIIDLSNLFNEAQTTTFVDLVHYSPIANEIISEAILREVF